MPSDEAFRFSNCTLKSCSFELFSGIKLFCSIDKDNENLSTFVGNTGFSHAFA